MSLNNFLWKYTLDNKRHKCYGKKEINTAGNVAAYVSSDYTLSSIQGYCRVTYSLSETKSLDIGTVINNSDLLLTFLLVFLR